MSGDSKSFTFNQQINFSNKNRARHSSGKRMSRNAGSTRYENFDKVSKNITKVLSYKKCNQCIEV